MKVYVGDVVFQHDGTVLGRVTHAVMLDGNLFETTLHTGQVVYTEYHPQHNRWENAYHPDAIDSDHGRPE